MSINFQIKPPRITVELFDRVKLKNAFKSLDKRVQVECKQLIQYIALELMNDMKRRAPVDMGQLRATIRPFFTVNGLVAEVGTTVGYGAFVEFGTGPKGKATFFGELPANYVHGQHGGFPPLRVIEEWCKRHGIDIRYAYPIAKKIAEEGLKAQPYINPAWQLRRDDLMKGLQKVFGGGLRL